MSITSLVWIHLENSDMEGSIKNPQGPNLWWHFQTLIWSSREPPEDEEFQDQRMKMVKETVWTTPVVGWLVTPPVWRGLSMVLKDVGVELDTRVVYNSLKWWFGQIRCINTTLIHHSNCVFDYFIFTLFILVREDIFESTIETFLNYLHSGKFYNDNLNPISSMVILLPLQVFLHLGRKLNETFIKMWMDCKISLKSLSQYQNTILQALCTHSEKWNGRSLLKKIIK